MTGFPIIPKGTQVMVNKNVYEDALTPGKVYYVENTNVTDSNGIVYLIKNDRGHYNWYNATSFNVKPQ